MARVACEENNKWDEGKIREKNTYRLTLYVAPRGVKWWCVSPPRRYIYIYMEQVLLDNKNYQVEHNTCYYYQYCVDVRLDQVLPTSRPGALLPPPCLPWRSPSGFLQETTAVFLLPPSPFRLFCASRIRAARCARRPELVFSSSSSYHCHTGLPPTLGPHYYQYTVVAGSL